MDLDARLNSIRTRGDLAEFVDLLADDLKTNPDEWGHVTLDGFLTALSGAIRVLDRIYRNQGRELSDEQDWTTFAEMLMSARIRE